MATDWTVIVEVDGPKNEGWFCRPLQRAMRGRLVWQRDSNPLASVEGPQLIAQPIPGERVKLTPTSVEVLEPLRLPEFHAVAAQLEKLGFAFRPAEQVIPGADVPTWLHHVRRAVEAGLLQIVEGKLPAPMKEEANARRDFLHAPGSTDSPMDRLAAAFERQAAALEKLVGKGT